MEQAGDEAALEGELEAHLEENRASLQAVEEALAADVENSELIMVTGSPPSNFLSAAAGAFVWASPATL
jgi:hypothetical protein